MNRTGLLLSCAALSGSIGCGGRVSYLDDPMGNTAGVGGYSS